MAYLFRSPVPETDAATSPESDAEWLLDAQAFRLEKAGEEVRLEPKVFDLLVLLVENRDRVLSKQELLDTLWPGEHVSDAVLPRCVAAARKSLGDTRSRQAVIQTVHGRGYRFVAPTREARRQHSDEPAPELSRQSTAVAAPPQPEEPFVGRDRVVASLRSALEDAIAGRGRLAVLVGEPGIGKTRTADEVAAEARERGASVLVGRCIEGEGAPAYWPWLQILRALDDADDDAQIVAELGGAPGQTAAPDASAGRPRSEPTAGEDARFQLFYRTCEALRRAAVRTPLMLVLDDLHRADPSSLLLLRFAARELTDSRILLLGTYRDVELRRGHPLAALLGELARLPHFQRSILRGLERSDVESYIEQTSGHAPPDGLTDAIFELTEGNPFFVGETVRWLEGRGELGGLQLDGTPQPAADGTRRWTLTLPQGAREAVGRRLDALSEACNHALQVASVQGRSFDLSTTERVLGTQRGPLLQLLEEAVSARVLRASPDDPASYSFSHAIVQQTVYEEISLPVRVHLHERTGEELEALHSGHPDAVAEELAHHFFQAATGGKTARAIEHLQRAARRATRLLAFEQAVAHYQRALQVLDLSADTEGRDLLRCELMLALGDEQSRGGERDAARRTFEIAAEQARSLGRSDLFAHAALGVGGRAELGLGEDPLLKGLLAEALERLPESSRVNRVLRSRLLSRQSGSPPYTYSMSERARLSNQAWQLALQTDDFESRVHALSARLWSLLGPDHVEERLALGEQALELSRQMRTTGKGFLSFDPAFLGHEAKLGAFLLRGDIAAADREIEAAEARAIALGEPVYLWFAHWWRASRAVSDGRYLDAEKMIAEGKEFSDHARHPLSGMVYAGLELWHTVNRGDWSRLYDGMKILEWNRLSLGAAVPACLSTLALSEDRVDDARRIFDGIAAHQFKDIERGEMWLFTMGILSELVWEFEDRERAAQLYELVQPYAGLNSVLDLLRVHDGAVAGYLAKLTATLGRHDEAQRHFEAAHAMNARMGARSALASTMYYEARWRLEHNRNRERAFEVLTRAESLAEEVMLGHRLVEMRALRQRYADGPV